MTERNSSSRDRGDWGADPELRALVRTGDPAHSLPPRSSGEVARLVAATIAADEAERSPVAQVAARRGAGRSWVPALVAAAVLVVAGVGVLSATGSESGTTPVADGVPGSPTTSAAPVVPTQPAASTTPTAPGAPAPGATPPAGPTVLAVPAVTARCMTPNVDVLKLQEIAFEGVVTAIDGSAVTLAPTSVYTGDVAETVQIQAPGPEMTSLLSAVSFEVGKTYLVSASQGQVTLCGFSAEQDPALRTLYEQAFAG